MPAPPSGVRRIDAGCRSLSFPHRGRRSAIPVLALDCIERRAHQRTPLRLRNVHVIALLRALQAARHEIILAQEHFGTEVPPDRPGSHTLGDELHVASHGIRPLLAESCQ